MTLAEWITLWLARQDERVTYSWYRTRKSLLLKHVAPRFGDVRLDDLQPRHLDDLYHTEGLSPSSRNKLVNAALRACLSSAVVRGEMDKAVFDRIYHSTKPFKERETVEPHPLSRDQMQQILGAAHALHDAAKPSWALFLEWQFSTGTRPSEALGLQHGNVNRDKRIAWITRGWVEGRWTTLKTASSRRTISIPEAVLSRIPRGPDGVRIFEAAGSLKHMRDFLWYPIVSSLGIPDTPFYATRATAITMMLQSGVSVADVARQVGDRISTIERHYYKHTGTTRLDLDRIW